MGEQERSSVYAGADFVSGGGVVGGDGGKGGGRKPGWMRAIYSTLVLNADAQCIPAICRLNATSILVWAGHWVSMY